MKDRINVLVIPAGSGMAIVAIKALLRDSKINVIAADMDSFAPGLFLAHKPYLVPPIDDQSFFDALERIVRKESIALIIPCLDTFLMPFCEKRTKFEEIGAKMILSPYETLSICRDKWRLYREIHEHLPMPKSVIPDGSVETNVDALLEGKDLMFPLIIKPRFGSGSKQVYIAENKNELDLFLKKVPDPIVQEYIFGQEYTVDMLVDGHGLPLSIVPRRRLEVKAGISTKGIVHLNDVIIEVGRKLCKLLKFFGPVNFQVILDTRDGIPKLTEVNPRISGGMSLTIASGVNIPALAVHLAMGEKVTIGKVREGLCMTRYHEELFFDINDTKMFVQA